MRNVEKEISFPTTRVKIKKNKKNSTWSSTNFPYTIKTKRKYFLCEFDRASLWKNSDLLDGGNGGLYIEVYRY